MVLPGISPQGCLKVHSVCSCQSYSLIFSVHALLTLSITHIHAPPSAGKVTPVSEASGPFPGIFLLEFGHGN